MTREEKLQLLSELCLEFGPTGSERYVAKVIKEKLGDTEYTVDRLGNIIVHFIDVFLQFTGKFPVQRYQAFAIIINIFL